MKNPPSGSRSSATPISGTSHPICTDGGGPEHPGQPDPDPGDADAVVTIPLTAPETAVAHRDRLDAERGVEQWPSPAGHRPQRGHNLGRGRRAARNLNVDRYHLADRADDTVGLGEHPAVEGAIAARDHHPRCRCRLEGVAQRLRHVAGHNTGHQQRIGVPRRRHQPGAEPFRVIDRAERTGISTSQPLHEPASTWRTCNDPAIRWGHRRPTAGRPPAGPVTRPTRTILAIQPMPDAYGRSCTPLARRSSSIAT